MVHKDHGEVGNPSFKFTIGNGITSRFRRLKNSVPQRSVLAPLLLNIYISDLSTTISRKYAYADDLANMHANGDWQVVEEVLSKDMATVGEYLQTCKLKLSTTKTLSAAFHFKNKEAKRQMKVNFNNETLPFCSEPKYLGVALDRPLTYRRHLESRRKKPTSRVVLLRRFGLRLGCLSNSSANSHPSPGAFNHRVLRSCLVISLYCVCFLKSTCYRAKGIRVFALYCFHADYADLVFAEV